MSVTLTDLTTAPARRGRPKRQPDAPTLSLLEAASELAMSPDRLATSIQAGTGPGRVQGSSYYIRRDWVESFRRGDPGFWDATYRQELAAALADRILSASENMTAELTRATLGAVPVTPLIRRGGR